MSLQGNKCCVVSDSPSPIPKRRQERLREAAEAEARAKQLELQEQVGRQGPAVGQAYTTALQRRRASVQVQLRRACSSCSAGLPAHCHEAPDSPAASLSSAWTDGGGQDRAAPG